MSESTLSKKVAPIFIMLAASLWAVDAIFRTYLTYTIPPASIVMFEHLLGFIILSPFLFKYMLHIRKLKLKDWLNLIALTVVSSVLGTILFTEALARSFAEFDFVTPILLQKLQPVFVIIMSALFLKERITKRFVLWAAAAVIGSYLMTFGIAAVKLQLAGKELVYLLALGAAFCWGSGTILSKRALDVLPFPAATALRFLLAVPIAFIFAQFLGQTYNFSQLDASHLWRFVVIASLTGGAFAIYLYYKGLQHTEAKISTFAELMLPIVSIFVAITPLNPYGQPQTLTVWNIMGILVLVGAIIEISRNNMQAK
jgi:drug/metabolite transporter (DMT)-like permease